MSKTWLITGASAGLGRLMTERLLTRGDRVVGTVRREGALADLQTEHGDRLAVTMLDLTDKVGIRAAVDGAFGRMGRIDVAVSNAGYGLFGAARTRLVPKLVPVGPGSTMMKSIPKGATSWTTDSMKPSMPHLVA